MLALVKEIWRRPRLKYIKGLGLGIGVYIHNPNTVFLTNICLISNSVSLRGGNRIFYEPSRKGAYEKEKPKLEISLASFRQGMLEIKKDIRKWREEIKEKLECDPIIIRPGDTDTIYHFRSQEDINQWVLACDKDYQEGFSHCALTLSSVGHGLFSGEIDLRIPEDGKVAYAGYCNMTSLHQMKSFRRKIFYDWTAYTHLVMKVRGDGRTYKIVLDASGEFDIEWSDRYIYIMPTRGGPYWQHVKIPFSKFYLIAKGRVQDKQFQISLNRVRTIGITCSDRINGSFHLEIDYIAVHFDANHKEEFAYELYKIPRFTQL